MAEREDTDASEALNTPRTPGAPAGDFGPADDDELLVDGQEEVFSRTEVESGRIEHRTGTDSAADDAADRT